MTGKQYIMQFVLIFVGMCPFIVWASSTSISTNVIVNGKSSHT